MDPPRRKSFDALDAQAVIEGGEDEVRIEALEPLGAPEPEEKTVLLNPDALATCECYRSTTASGFGTRQNGDGGGERETSSQPSQRFLFPEPQTSFSWATSIRSMMSGAQSLSGRSVPPPTDSMVDELYSAERGQPSRRIMDVFGHVPAEPGLYDKFCNIVAVILMALTVAELLLGIGYIVFTVLS